MTLKEYVIKNRWLWFLVFLFTLLCHGSMLLGDTVGIDTEDLIVRHGMFYESWLTTGRQGLVVLKKLMGNVIFSPYLSGAMALVFLTLACILWTWLFSRITGKVNKAAVFVFSMLLNASSILTEQLYFKLQAAEISLSFCLTALSLSLVYGGRGLLADKRKRLYGLLCLCGAVCLNLITFSAYQVLVALFIFGAAACFVLWYFFGNPGMGEGGGKSCWRFIVIFAGIFFVSFVCNQVITALFFSGSDYLAAQIQWTSRPLGECLRDIGLHMEYVLIGGQAYRILLRLLHAVGVHSEMVGGQIYYDNNYGVFCILVCVAVVLYFRKRGKRGAVPAVTGVLGCLLAPFYMTFLCGGEQVIRSQLVLPFALAFLAYALLLFFPDSLPAYGVLALCLLTGYQQMQYTLRLNYTDQVRYESDVRIASAIMEEINRLEDGECSYPVVFIGSRQAELNTSCLRGEPIGYSFFEWDTAMEPPGFHNTMRILGFMHTLGVDYAQADPQQTAAAVEYSGGMADWPQEGSVVLRDGVIIIRLSGYGE